MPRGDPQATPAWVYAQLLRLEPSARDAPLCVAFSGGEDSTALLDLLGQSPLARPRLRAVHIDHGLHPQSRAWARHCRVTCRALGIPLHTRRLALPAQRGQSLEALARAGRYAALAALLGPGELLLSAHHLEDQLETVLLQLLRGAGLPGLAAMPAVSPLGRGILVRPLLELPRAKLRAWVRARGLGCLADPSNADDRLDRNYLRHHVLPPIVQRWSGAARSVSRSARHVAAAQDLLDGQARADAARAADGAGLSVAALRALPLPRRRNALRFWIGHSGAADAAGLRGGHDMPDSRRLEQIAVTVLDARAGANPQVEWGSLCVQRHDGRLLLTRVGPPAADYELHWNRQHSPRLVLPQQAGWLELAPSGAGLIDASLLPVQLTVRTRRGGERLRPRAGGPSRPLKSLLQSERISLMERRCLPLLFAGDHLVAAGDLWVDARWQSGAADAKRLRVVWRRSS